MSDQSIHSSHAPLSPEEMAHFRRHARHYLIVGALLLAGTALTVAASFIDFGTPSANIKVALLIAAVKASLVATVFMHLRHEKLSIYQVLAVTGFFALGLFMLSILAFYDHIHL